MVSLMVKRSGRIRIRPLRFSEAIPETKTIMPAAPGVPPRFTSLVTMRQGPEQHLSFSFTCYFGIFARRMKKLACLSWMAFYLLGVMGFGITSHYCCGKVASVSITCAVPNRSSASAPAHCCDDITHSFKIQDAQQASFPGCCFHAPVFQVPQSSGTSVLLIRPATEAATDFFSAESPPWLTTLPLFIRHEAFLI